MQFRRLDGVRILLQSDLHVRMLVTKLCMVCRVEPGLQGTCAHRAALGLKQLGARTGQQQTGRDALPLPAHLCWVLARTISSVEDRNGCCRRGLLG